MGNQQHSSQKNENATVLNSKDSSTPSKYQKQNAVSRKAQFIADFSFNESVFMRQNDIICWQTQEENEIVEHFELLDCVYFCVRPTYVVANHALAIYKIRREERSYFLVVELIPTGEDIKTKKENIVLNFVVLKNFPENVTKLATYKCRNGLFVLDLVETGASFLTEKGAIYDLLEHNCFHYVEHVLSTSCEDYDRKAIKDLERFKLKTAVVATGIVLVTSAIGAWYLKRRAKKKTESKLIPKDSQDDQTEVDKLKNTRNNSDQLSLEIDKFNLKIVSRPNRPQLNHENEPDLFMNPTDNLKNTPNY